MLDIPDWEDQDEEFAVLRDWMYEYLRINERLSRHSAMTYISSFRILFYENLLNSDKDELEEFLDRRGYITPTKTKFRRVWKIYNEVYWVRK